MVRYKRGTLLTHLHLCGILPPLAEVGIATAVTVPETLSLFICVR